jgi:DNA repair exonuclease SbcCD nuclease subunit
MKIGIVADTHFGYSRFEADALSQGKEAILSAAGSCDALILAGDIFDTRVPKPETLSEAVKIMRHVHVPVFAIHGTHERRSKGMVNPIEMLETAGLLRSVHNKAEIFEKSGEKVAISGMGGVPDDMAKGELATLAPKPVPGAFNIFMLHQSFSEYIFAKSDMLSLADLPPGFDLYICGHMHKNVVALDGKFLIPGSTVITQMRPEETGPKGYYIYDTKLRKPEFVPINSRPFFFKELKFEKAGMEKVRSACTEYISECIKHSKEKPIIRMKLTGSLAPGVASQDLSLAPLSANERAIIQIDSEFEEATLKEKIERIRNLREKRASVREIGMEMLRERLKHNGSRPEDAESLFSALSDDSDAVLADIERKVRDKSGKK